MNFSRQNFIDKFVIPLMQQIRFYFHVNFLHEKALSKINDHYFYSTRCNFFDFKNFSHNFCFIKFLTVFWDFNWSMNLFWVFFRFPGNFLHSILGFLECYEINRRLRHCNVKEIFPIHSTHNFSPKIKEIILFINH